MDETFPPIAPWPDEAEEPTAAPRRLAAAPEPEPDILEQIARQREVLRRKADELDKIEARQFGNATGPWMSYERVLSISKDTADRIPTGFAALDALIDGGLHQGSVIVVQGRPGIGKTLLATQLALGLARFCSVAALYADEGLRGASITIGQQIGVNRRALERCFEDAVKSACSGFASTAPHWMFLDPLRRESTLEFLAEGSDRMANETGLPPVWLIDSAQVVRSAVRQPRMTTTERISAVMEQIRELALKHRAIALVCSKVNRGSYRNKQDELNSEDLAAGFGSSDIEYTTELILHLSGNPKKNPVLRAAKNRISAEGEFEISLVLDMDRKRYVAKDLAQSEAEEAAGKDAATSVLLGAVEAFVRANPNSSTRFIRDNVKGKAAAIGEALKELRATNRVFSEEVKGKGGGTHWYVGEVR